MKLNILWDDSATRTRLLDELWKENVPGLDLFITHAAASSERTYPEFDIQVYATLPRFPEVVCSQIRRHDVLHVAASTHDVDAQGYLDFCDYVLRQHPDVLIFDPFNKDRTYDELVSFLRESSGGVLETDHAG